MKKRLILCTSLMLLLGGAALASCGPDVPPVVESGALEVKGENTIYVSGSTVLSVKSDGKNISATVTWTSSDETVATVNANGKVSGLKAGTVTITAEAEGYTKATFTLTVKDNTQDITVYITPSFEAGSKDSAVAEGYAIFFGSSIDNWAASHPCTYEEGKGWKISFEDVEIDQTISYNTYYDKVDGSGWKFINTESVANSARQLEIVEGVTEYAINSTFNVPSSVESVKLKISASLTSGAALGSDVHLWVASSANNWTLTKATLVNGVWEYVENNVPVGDSYGVTLALGSATKCDWTYKASDVDGKYFSVDTDTTELVFSAKFAAQPDYSAKTHQVTIVFSANDVPGQNVECVVDTNSWNKMTYNSTTKTYSVTLELSQGTHHFYFYSWKNVDYKLYDASGSEFQITVDSAQTYTYTGSFGSLTGSLVS